MCTAITNLRAANREPKCVGQVLRQKKFRPFSGFQSCFSSRLITQVPLKAQFYPPLVPRGRVKLLVNILQFGGPGLYWDRAVHLHSPWLFTQLRLMGSRSHLDHYESPHYLSVKRFIWEMGANLSKDDVKVEENLLLLLWSFSIFKNSRKICIFLTFLGREKWIRCSLFFCCHSSYIAAPTVPGNHWKHNPDIWWQASIKLKLSSGFKELSTLTQTLCKL